MKAFYQNDFLPIVSRFPRQMADPSVYLLACLREQYLFEKVLFHFQMVCNLHWKVLRDKKHSTMSTMLPHVWFILRLTLSSCISYIKIVLAGATKNRKTFAES